MRVPASVSVILSTYNQPRWLEKALWGYAAQRMRDFEVVVADDGSGPETADVIVRMQGHNGLRLVHVWHEDRGFRKTEILNRAVIAARGDYLIFSDGDCIPHPEFVATHGQGMRGVDWTDVRSILDFTGPGVVVVQDQRIAAAQLLF